MRIEHDRTHVRFICESGYESHMLDYVFGNKVNEAGFVGSSLAKCFLTKNTVIQYVEFEKRETMS